MYYTEKEFFDIIAQHKSEKDSTEPWKAFAIILSGIIMMACLATISMYKIGIIVVIFVLLKIWDITDLARKKKLLPKLHITVHKNLSFTKRFNSLFKWEDFNLSREEFCSRFSIFYDDQFDFDKKIYFQSLYYKRYHLVFFIPKRQDIQKKNIENLAKVFERKVEYLRYSQSGTLIILSRTKYSSFSAFSNWFWDLNSQSKAKQKQIYKEIKAIADLVK